MPDPAIYNFRFQRGTFGAESAIIVQFLGDDGQPVPLPGVNFTLTAQYNAYALAKATADGSMSFDVPTATLTWLPSADEVAAIPLGATAPYQLEALFPDGSGLRLAEGFLVGRA